MKLNKDHIEHLSEEAIAKYLQNELSSKEMHSVEKHLLSCTFCSEAVEGFESFTDIDIVRVTNKLHGRLQTKTTKKIGYYRISIAASIALLLSFSIFFIYNVLEKEDGEIALSTSSSEEKKLFSKEINTDSTILEIPTEKVSEPVEINKTGTEETIIPKRLSESSKKVSKPKPQIIINNKEKQVGINSPEKSETEVEQVVKVDLIVLADEEVLEEVMDLDIVVESDEVLAITDASFEEVEPNTVTQKSVVVAKRKARTSFSTTAIDENKEGQEQLLNASDMSRAGMQNTDAQIVKAQPIGGYEAYNSYLKAALEYPKLALENRIEGILKVNLKLSKKGKILNITVLDSLGFGCEEEAIRLIKNGVKWQPSKLGTQNIANEVELKVEFRLE